MKKTYVLSVFFLSCLSVNIVNSAELKVQNSSNRVVNNTSRPAVQVKQKKDPLIHIVKDGETIYRIALNYQVSQDDLRRVNNLTNNTIFVGERLVMPENAIRPAENSQNVVNNNIIANDVRKQEEEKTAKAQNQVIDTSKLSSNAKQNITNQIEGTTFLWPVRGIIISKFGHLTNGGRLEGVNIAVEKGTIVKSAASGEVVYSGNVEGYDNVILIRHYNGFITAYGHTDPLVVNGDKINKGQVIAYVLPNKQSKRSMLYFSIRKNKKSYDPEKMIAAKISE